MWNFWQKINLFNLLLTPVSGLFFCLVQTRRWLYKHHFLTAKTINIPVVVVGNITVGGNKKSSFVLKLASELSDEGLKVGVVSRGYGSQIEKTNKIVEVFENSNVKICGDEPLMIKQSNPNLFVFVGKNRAEVAKQCEKKGVDVIICDDGLQHYKLNRDIEIILNDTHHNGFMLPAGALREPISRLKQANFVINTSNLIYKPMLWQNCFDISKKENLNFDLKKHSFYGVCALAKNEQFKLSVEKLGIEIKKWIFFKDHHFYCQKDFANLDDDAVILTTHKDAVKLKKNWFAKNQQCYYLKSSLFFDDAVMSEIKKEIINLIK